MHIQYLRRPRGSLRLHLPLDPEVSFAETFGYRYGGRPAQRLLDEGVVAVSSPHALWAGDVLDGQILALETHGDPREFVHRHLECCTKEVE